MRGGNLFTITGRRNCALSLVGRKLNQFYSKVLPLSNCEEEWLLSACNLSTCLSRSFVLTQCCVLTWVTKIRMLAISNVHAGPSLLTLDPDQSSATYGPRAGSGLPSNIIRPAAPSQIVVTVWPAKWCYVLWICRPCNFLQCILIEKPHCAINVQCTVRRVLGFHYEVWKSGVNLIKFHKFSRFIDITNRKWNRLQQKETFIVRPFLYEYACILRWSVRIGFVVEKVRLLCRIPQFSDHILLTRTCCRCWHATSLTMFMAVDTSSNTKALMNLSFHESCNCSVLNADFCSQTYSRF